MLPESVLLIVIISVVSCQLDGEFWWINNDITKLKHGTAPPPKFDDVNELDTDETAKVFFRDAERKEGKSLKYDKETINNFKDTISVIHFRDETELAKPSFESNRLNSNNKLWERPLKKMDIKKNHSFPNMDDEFRFVFPSDDNLVWTGSEPDISKKENVTTENKVESSNKNSFTTTLEVLPPNGGSSTDKSPLLPENICTFIRKSECIRNEGTLYEPWLKSNIKMTIPNTQVICCILPITTTSIAKIIFPDEYWSAKRHKRSNEDHESSALKQRNNLMSRKYVPDNQKVRATTASTRKKTNQKFVYSDEYSTDPYWNIKNSNIRNSDTPTYQDPDADYGSQSYGDDYTVELPKPGLMGLYSDNKQTSQTTWTHNNNNGFYYDSLDSVEEEEFETPFGYSTIDPRQDHRLTKPPKRRPSRPRPLKLTALPSRIPEPGLLNPTITFHANPDFQVLQGFKLLNLVRNKNRFVRKTPENNKECADNGEKIQEKPLKLTNYVDNHYEHNLFRDNLEQKLFKECGKGQTNRDDCKNGLQQGVVEFGSHPWIALVVLTKSEDRILCYATIVHSRVAVSVADCVNGESPGAVSIIGGVRNLDDDLAQSQRRMATVVLDPDYSPGDMEHNLALLHWLRPLLFDAKIQPACLGDPPTEGSCVFVGWGGYDQEMHSDLRWQRGSVLTPQDCNKRLSKLEVSDAHCAAVESRGTVTGVGGPLLCKSNDRWSVVGVAAWRNDVIILLPPRDWVIRTMISLRIQ